MPRRLLAVLCFLLLPPMALSAQSTGLRSKITDLFVFGGTSDPLKLGGTATSANPGIAAHGNHFIPSANAENGTIIRFLVDAIGGNVSNVPIGATSGSETFQFVNGVPVATSTSSGPIFAERGQTMGRGRAIVGLGHTSFSFSTLRGVPMSDVKATFTHENSDFPGCTAALGQDCKQMGVPNYENDVINLDLNMQINVDVTTLYLTYGLFDKMDVGVVLPLVSTHLRGSSIATIVPFGPPPVAHFFAGDFNNPVLTAQRDVEGSSFGVGDVALRSKLLIRESPSGTFSLVGDARFPSGDAEDLLGSGHFSARALAVLSGKTGDISPHTNIGFLYRAGSTQNSAVLGTAGFDAQVDKGLTLAADLVSELQVGRSKLALPQPVHFDAPYVRDVAGTTIPEMRDDIVNASVGFKLVTSSSVVIVANALAPLNRGGLRASVIYTGALEFNF